MSRENVELVRRGIQSVEAFWSLLDEDVVWDLGESPPPDLHGDTSAAMRLSRLLATTGAPGTTTASMQRSS